jgi:NADPH:quinone reductase-like Zn-dependent oxidoreductase
VLVQAAAGGVGHLAVQIAKAMGAYVIGTASAAKHDFLRGLGADEVVDYRAHRFEDVVSGVDAVIELAGGDTAARSLATLRPGGVLVDVAHGGPRGLGAGTGKKVTTMLVAPDGHGLRELAALAAAGRLDVAVDATDDLAEAATAHEHGEKRATSGKLVLRCG